MNLTPTATPIGTVPRHFAVVRTLRRQPAPPTFGLYRPGSLYPGEYEDAIVDALEGADQPELTDYSGPISTRPTG